MLVNLFIPGILAVLLSFLNYHPIPGLKSRAEKLSQNYIILDSHIDLPDRILGRTSNMPIWTEGQFDYEKASSGGLNVAFMSIYVSSSKSGNEAYKHANDLIDLVEKICRSYPYEFAQAYDVADVRTQFHSDRISLPMGMENGSPLNGDLKNLDHFYNRGIRYITLSHFKSNDICDSSTDTDQPHNGLSEFGEKVVRRMNELGMMIDVSHVSDATIEHVLELSKAPVIASHSSCKNFTPEFNRNLSDDLIERIAGKEGIIMVNFGNMFQNHEASTNFEKMRKGLEEKQLEPGTVEGDEFMEKFRKEYPIESDIKEVVDHIDHIVKLVGIDHVGFGSDFDGVGSFVPKGLEDVSKYPDLIDELLKRDYSNEDIKKICGENFLRVWKTVEVVAQ